MANVNHVPIPSVAQEPPSSGLKNYGDGMDAPPIRSGSNEGESAAMSFPMAVACRLTEVCLKPNLYLPHSKSVFLALENFVIHPGPLNPS